MIRIDRKTKYELENQVIAKMFREDKRFRTRIIPNKKKAYRDGKRNYMDQITETQVPER
tara:strand:+ start:609 stop:785 length:177 start_codon:yes stop_codon:yes gene_type:complete